MIEEAITERLKFLTELLRFAFVALLAVGGGTLGLLLGPQDLLRWGFAGAGIVLVAQASGLCTQPGWLRHHKQHSQCGV